LIVHQSSNLPHLPHNLRNPIQMRLNDAVGNKTPKFQCANPTNVSHTITVKGDDLNYELSIPCQGETEGCRRRTPITAPTMSYA
jgi:hypothetical protein